MVSGARPSDYPLRSFDGTGNNVDNPAWGTPGSTQVRSPNKRGSYGRRMEVIKAVLWQRQDKEQKLIFLTPPVYDGQLPHESFF